MYELLVGEVPVGEEIEDPYELYEITLKQPVEYPGDFMVNKNPEAYKFIEIL